jgi:hypothetical protein
MYEDHFQEEKIESFEIDGGKFEYKATTAGQENDWLSYYLIEKVEIDPDTGEKKVNFRQDIGMLNKLRICNNLINVPYSKAQIKSQIGIDKEWVDLSKDEKWLLMSKLHPKILSKIFESIVHIESNSIEKKK